MYHVIVWQEGELFVAKVLENSVSSFGKTRDEAYNNVQEALKLFLEDIPSSSLDSRIQKPELYSVEISRD